jgi:hypothetical protein
MPMAALACLAFRRNHTHMNAHTLRYRLALMTARFARPLISEKETNVAGGMSLPEFAFQRITK